MCDCRLRPIANAIKRTVSAAQKIEELQYRYALLESHTIVGFAYLRICELFEAQQQPRIYLQQKSK